MKTERPPVRIDWDECEGKTVAGVFLDCEQLIVSFTDGTHCARGLPVGGVVVARGGVLVAAERLYQIFADALGPLLQAGAVNQAYVDGQAKRERDRMLKEAAAREELARDKKLEQYRKLKRELDL